MNWNWQTIKEQVRLFYGKASQLIVFLLFCHYLLACIVAAKPVSPRGYVGFAWHTFQYQPGRAVIAPAAYVPDRSKRDNSDNPHMNFVENR